jgi:uncharacterized protein YjbI with pentapeptide repeats
MATMPDNKRRSVEDPWMAPVSVDLADAVVQGVQAGFGILALGIGVALRALGESPGKVPRQPGPRMPASEVADLVLGTAWGAARLSGRVVATGARITGPAIGVLLRPPLVPRRLQPGHGLQMMVERWQRDRPETLRTVGRWSATALPGAVEAALGQVDVEQVAAVVLDRVDVEQVAAVVLDRVDLDVLLVDMLRRLDVTAMALAVLEGLDLTAVVEAAIGSTDLDRVAGDALGKLDVDELADRLLDQLDLTQLVLDRVDLERVVAGALARLDLTTIVVDRVDLGSVVSAALEQVDLTSIVVDRVDLGGLVSAALQQVDLTQIVMQQVDLLGVAEYVVDGIDLPEIIRDSTGSVASEAVVGLRLQGVDADVAVGRAVDRILRRRRPHRTDIVLDDMDLAGTPPDPATKGPE